MIERVESDAAFAELALSAELSRARLEPRHRGLATELSYGTLRLRGRLDASIAQVCDRKLSVLDPAVRNVLRLGAYQLLFLTRVHDAAAVDESVKLARWAGDAKATGVVNAVLRRLAKERERLSFPVLEQDPLAYLETLGSLPTWLAQRWLDELGPEQAAALAKALNRRRRGLSGWRPAPTGRLWPSASGVACVVTRPTASPISPGIRWPIRRFARVRSRSRTRRPSWSGYCSIYKKAKAYSIAAPRRAPRPRSWHRRLDRAEKWSRSTCIPTAWAWCAAPWSD